MSFDNNVYPNRKDNRRNYDNQISKRCSRGCRNQGSCNYCRENRLIKTSKDEMIAKEELANVIFEKDTDMKSIDRV